MTRRHAARLAAAMAWLLAAPLAAAPAGRLAASPLVCIDPGHPSETSRGAASHGLTEIRVNWQVALMLRTRLRALGIASVLTKRREAEYVTNRRRAEVANRAHATLFLRLHCDSGSPGGATCYYPAASTTVQGVTGPPRAVRQASRRAAERVRAGMAAVLRGVLPVHPVRTDAATAVGRRQGGALTGSVFARVPTVLVEMCVLDRPADRRFIASPAGRERMARALAAGVQAWLRVAGRAPRR